MAITSCTKCDGKLWELKEMPPIMGASFRYFAIQCSQCGAVIGVQEFNNAGAMIAQLEKRVADLSHQLDSVRHAVAQLDQSIRRR